MRFKLNRAFDICSSTMIITETVLEYFDDLRKAFAKNKIEILAIRNRLNLTNNISQSSS